MPGVLLGIEGKAVNRDSFAYIPPVEASKERQCIYICIST